MNSSNACLLVGHPEHYAEASSPMLPCWGELGYKGIALINGICASMTKTLKTCLFPAIIEHYDKILKSYTVVGDGKG